MPGRRLTDEERQRIAAALVVGLSCAEIGRRLCRPASTISREVARNGGIHRYRANHAQQATRWRARRRKLHPLPQVPPTEHDAVAQRDFEDDFAAMMTDTGMPAMAAKVLACLFTADTASHTSASLVTRLRVSPASVSKAVTWLERRGLVSREHDGRRQRYVLADQVWYRTWQESVRTMARWADFAQHGADLFGADSQARARLHATSHFFRFLGHDMAQAAEHWRQTVTTQPDHSSYDRNRFSVSRTDTTGPPPE